MTATQSYVSSCCIAFAFASQESTKMDYGASLGHCRCQTDLPIHNRKRNEFDTQCRNYQSGNNDGYHT